jgi:hypothetical protein
MKKYSMSDSPIIIIGMGSSGTRLVVEILERCGIFMGGALSQNEFKEPAIFFAGINAFTDTFRYLDPLPGDWQQIVENKADEVQRFVDEILPKEYAAAGYTGGQWGFKDPRNTFVLPLYIRSFPKCRVIHVVRDGRDVALTKISENWPNLNETHRLDRWFRVWENNISVAAAYKKALSANQFIEIRYEDVCLYRPTATDLLSKFLHIPNSVIADAGKDLAHQNRLFKWRERCDAFDFANDSESLRKYDYI